jgi:hypothetical protein
MIKQTAIQRVRVTQKVSYATASTMYKRESEASTSNHSYAAAVQGPSRLRGRSLSIKRRHTGNISDEYERSRSRRRIEPVQSNINEVEMVSGNSSDHLK